MTAADRPVGGTGAGDAGGAPRRRHRTVLWVALTTAAVVAALIAVVASSQPSSDVSAQSPLLGHPAPRIAGSGLDGGHYDLRQFRGKWVLVNFMATWCPPCRQEMPQLLRFGRQHERKEDATLLTVADDPTNVSQLRAYLAAKGAGWPAVNDPGATISYGLTGLPSSFLVTPGGLVYAYAPGEVNAREVDGWIRQGAARGFGRA
ncbi:MAG: TlpA family protein disulfide reductase [Acidimicrobiales bacterium]